MHGPEGTGKTAFMQKMSQEIGKKSNFCITELDFIEYPIFSINAMQTLSKYSGEKESILTNLFLTAHNNAPSIIFIDELDGISDQNDEMSIKFTKLIDDTQWDHKIFIICATNSIMDVNKNFKRIGRLDFEIKFDPPTSDGRYEIFKLNLEK